MAVSVLYYVNGQTATGAPSQINGATTPPTAQQASTVQRMTAQVVMAAADTQAVVTHNWGLTTLDNTYFNPIIIAEFATGGVSASGTFLPAFTYDRTGSNVLKINKVSTAVGSDGTFNFTLLQKAFASR